MYERVNMQKPQHLLAIIGTFFIFTALPLTVYLVTTSQERAREDAQAAGPLKGDFETSDFISGLNQPTSMAFAPDGRLFVTEKGGKVRVIKNGELLATPFLTVQVDTHLERGLVGIAFDPDFENNKLVYIHYTRVVSHSDKGRVSHFTASGNNPDVAILGSEVVILDNIFSGGRHDAGNMRFDKDGYLFISIGDGGFNYYLNAQNTTNYNGSILRINKDGTIPSDNPLVGQFAQGAIWAWGLRNPFTFDIDPVTGKIFANDVGQNTWEEINEIKKGENYGWAPCEGPEDVGVEHPVIPNASCSNSAYTPPIYSYNRSGIAGSSIAGAAFYRGDQFPSEYDGKYFFGDYGQSFIKTLDPNNHTVSDFTTDIQNPVDIRVGPDGALYFLSFSWATNPPTGFIKKIQFAPPSAVASVDPVIGATIVTRNFNASASKDINKLPLTYFWDFGDGASGFGKKASHNYTTYNPTVFAKVTATNSHGASSESEPIRIIVAKCADLVGDDGFVSIGDILVVVGAFGSSPGDDNWNEAADLDDNGTVVIGDIVYAVAQFGMSCTV